MLVPFPFLKNSKGEADGMWTLTAIAFVGAQAAVFLRPSAATSALTLFSACAAIYWGRKHTDTRKAAADLAPAKKEPSP